MMYLLQIGSAFGIGTLIIAVIIGLLALGFLMLFFRFFGLWFRALLSGAHVGLGRLVGMWLRKVDPSVIVDSRIMLTKAGIDVSSDMLETHFLARGNVRKVSQAMVAANKANIPLPFQRAAAIDLA
ncbi:MAG: flotillin-like FloA family protein, partial [Treponema sp.]|nr:flotillin-like FloA family protein [Treponema sp.]